MPYVVKVLADSVAPNGCRLTTILGRIPRIMLAEANTHRLFSRNSASSRAVPTPKLLAILEADPFIPIYWGKNQAGMSAAEALSPEDQEITEREWLELAAITRRYVERWHERGVHKQIANRPLEWFSWHEVIVSSTEWENFLRLRAPAEGPMDPTFPAQPEFQVFAVMVRDALRSSVPKQLSAGQWHLPLIDELDRAASKERNRLTVTDPDGTVTYGESVLDFDRDLCKISVAKCAAVSYLRHEDERSVADWLKVYDKLATSGHWSPFEHIARAITRRPKEEGPIPWSGNFCGWRQLREDVDPHFTRVGR